MAKIIEFCGRRLDEMSKSELIEVIHFAVEETEMVRSDAERQRNFLSNLRKTT